MHQNRRLHVKTINSLHSPFGLGQPLAESIASKWITSWEWRWCIKVEWEKSTNDVGSSPLTHASRHWDTVEMDGRRQEELIYLRKLLNRQIAKAKGHYTGVIVKYNQIPIRFFWTITALCSGINLIHSALHLFLSASFSEVALSPAMRFRAATELLGDLDAEMFHWVKQQMLL